MAHNKILFEPPPNRRVAKERDDPWWLLEHGTPNDMDRAALDDAVTRTLVERRLPRVTIAERLIYWWTYDDLVIPLDDLLAVIEKHKIRPEQEATWKALAFRYLGERHGVSPEVAEEQWKQQEAEKRERSEREQRERQVAEERAKLLRLEEERKVQQEKDRADRTQRFRLRVEPILTTSYLTADAAFDCDPEAQQLGTGALAAAKAAFVQRWFTERDGTVLSSEQAHAVAETGKDLLVVARAGSGKTRIVVSRAEFLLRHCGVSPNQILILAFNRRAASEVQQRLSKVSSGRPPHVMTFHALAHAVVHPDEDLIFDETEARPEMSRAVQGVIDHHLHSQRYRPIIRDLMLAYFRNEWDQIVAGAFHLDKKEFLTHRRSLARETLRGEFVKSAGEKIIANTLFEHGVRYHYERNFRWGDTNYRPDFTIPVTPATGLIVEYFGLAGEPDYDEMSNRKREFWRTRSGWELIEVSADDLRRLGDEDFSSDLLRRLSQAGAEVSRRTEDEIWEMVRARAVDRFSMLMRTFISRCRKKHWSSDDLRRAILTRQADRCSIMETNFLTIGASVYGRYLAFLASAGKEDFDGLLWRAAQAVRAGHTRFARDRGRERGDLRALRFVMVDEFQDFSRMFFEIVSAIRGHNPDANWFCVGDDWQAINGFAGAETTFFGGFESYFAGGKRHELTSNFRSAASVVAAGNALMTGRGSSAKATRSEAGLVTVCDMAAFVPSNAERVLHGADEITPALLRVILDRLNRNEDLVLLARRNEVPWFVRTQAKTGRGLQAFVEHIRSFLPEEDRVRVKASTVHSFKGLEETAVVVIDALGGSYPLIHPTWGFLRVFGDTLTQIVEDERRLFYVAASRAVKTLLLFTESHRESEFLRDILHKAPISKLDWRALSPVGEFLEIGIYDAFDTKNELRRRGYSWDNQRRAWCRAVPRDGFSFEALTRQAWVRAVGRVEVRSMASQLLYEWSSHPNQNRAATDDIPF